MGDGGKGDGPRDPARSVSKREYNKRFDQIDWTDSQSSGSREELDLLRDDFEIAMMVMDRYLSTYGKKEE